MEQTEEEMFIKQCSATIIKGQRWYSPEDLAVILKAYKAKSITKVFNRVQNAQNIEIELSRRCKVASGKAKHNQRAYGLQQALRIIKTNITK